MRKYLDHAIGSLLTLAVFTVLLIGAVIGWSAKGAYDHGKKVGMGAPAAIALAAGHSTSTTSKA